MDWTEKDFKPAIITMHKELKRILFKELKYDDGNSTNREYE